MEGRRVLLLLLLLKGGVVEMQGDVVGGIRLLGWSGCESG